MTDMPSDAVSFEDYERVERALHPRRRRLAWAVAFAQEPLPHLTPGQRFDRRVELAAFLASGGGWDYRVRDVVPTPSRRSGRVRRGDGSGEGWYDRGRDAGALVEIPLPSDADVQAAQRALHEVLAAIVQTGEPLPLGTYQVCFTLRPSPGGAQLLEWLEPRPSIPEQARYALARLLMELDDDAMGRSAPTRTMVLSVDSHTTVTRAVKGRAGRERVDAFTWPAGALPRRAAVGGSWLIKRCPAPAPRAKGDERCGRWFVGRLNQVFCSGQCQNRAATRATRGRRATPRSDRPQKGG